jgi:hypothetical protein
MTSNIYATLTEQANEALEELAERRNSLVLPDISNDRRAAYIEEHMKAHAQSFSISFSRLKFNYHSASKSLTIIRIGGRK